MSRPWQARAGSGQAKSSSTTAKAAPGSTARGSVNRTAKTASTPTAAGRAPAGNRGKSGSRAQAGDQAQLNRGQSNGRRPGGDRGQASRGPGGGRGPGSGRGPGNGPGSGGRPGPGRTAGQRQVSPAAAETPVPRFGAPPWIRWTALVLSLAGFGMSVYMTIAHYTSTSILACSNKGYINCAKVTTSPESMVFGVFPVAVLGLAFYVFMVAINSPWAWRSQLPLIWWARIGGIITGIGFVLYLIYAEVIQIGNICLDCTTVHIITFLLFGVLVYAAALGSGGVAAAKTAR